MNTIALREYAVNLSGRPLGISTLSKILAKYGAPYILDFSGVFSLGSSFADEVVAKLARENGGEIRILNANSIVKKCLADVSEEHGFVIHYENS